MPGSPKNNGRACRVAVIGTYFVLITSTALGARLTLAVPVALGAPLFVNLVFAKLLRVPLPSGLLPLPWLGLP